MPAGFKSRVMCAGKKYAQRKSKEVGVSARSLSAPYPWPWTILTNPLQLRMVNPAAHCPLVSVEVDGRVPGVSAIACGALAEVFLSIPKLKMRTMPRASYYCVVMVNVVFFVVFVVVVVAW